jgi:MFS superfamily sulfate permease-like transporter
MLLFAPGLLRNLPNTALAAVVIASALGLFEIADLRRLYRIQRWEFWLSIACFAGVALVGPIQGILLAIIIALLAFVWDSWRPYFAVLGKPDGVRGYHDITRYPDAQRVPGLVLFRWDAPLFFANAERFRQEVKTAVSESPTPVRWLVVAAEPVTGIDITAVDMLSELDDELQQARIELVFAEMKDPVKDSLKQFGVFKKLGEHLFFATLEEAVDAYLATSEAEIKE